MRFTRFRFAAGLILLALLFGCTPTPTAPMGPTLELGPCHLSAPGIANRIPASCGTLEVPEDRAHPDGAKIQLYVAVVPAISKDAAGDPLVFITGGPGESATQDYLRLYTAFSRINQKRDILLVDQRGTGKSNPLDCPDIDLEAGDDSETAKNAITNCYAALPGNPNFYTTAAAVEDLEAVRQALGYPQLNLYGISYGTRVAQTYMIRYPQNVRTAILDGVVPQDEALGSTVSSDAQRALDKVFARCAAQTDCNAAFPDLPGTLKSMQEELDQHPITVTVTHPTSGAPTEVRFTRDTLAGALRLFSYSPETTALLPLLLHSAQETGDYSRLAALSLIAGQELQGSISQGMNYSVVCAEDVPFLFDEKGNFKGDYPAEKATYLGDYVHKLVELCRDWPVNPVSADFKEPIHSDIPTLLLSGEADPVTPPVNAAQVAAGLTHGLSLVAPGQGHGVAMRGCMPLLITDFVAAGDFAALDTGCVAQIQPPPFFLNFAGSNP